VSNFDVPATFAAPIVPEVWNETHRPAVRPRCVAGMRNGIDVPCPWSGEPLDLVPAGHLRVFVFGDPAGAAQGRPLGDVAPLGCFAFAEPAVLRVGDPVRVDGRLVGYLCGFAGAYAAIQSWHSFCGGELEAGPATLLEIGGSVEG